MAVRIDRINIERDFLLRKSNLRSLIISAFFCNSVNPCKRDNPVDARSFPW
jgi:hypothetical protein